MRTLAIDLGQRRVGLALSDEGGRFATPLQVLEISAPQQALDRVLAVVAREGVARIVLGLPLNMDETVGPAARQVIRWGKDLEGRAGISVVYVDERLSSFAAEQSLADRKRGGEKLTRKRKKEQLDALAAAGFLQEFLDGKLVAITPPER
ncbi:MAG TPA: Holliday junction resolvase RuvX [Tepidisphaeraceae bacterium]|jgi:putative Holliday junction resolvase